MPDAKRDCLVTRMLGASASASSWKRDRRVRSFSSELFGYLPSLSVAGPRERLFLLVFICIGAKARPGLDKVTGGAEFRGVLGEWKS